MVHSESKNQIGHEVPNGMVRIKLEITRRGKVIEVFVPKKKSKPKTKR